MPNPLLSICIPTYNRASILDENLNHITSNKAFDEEVEIVISDNCSTDNTEEICREYSKRFSNVKYFKNEENVVDNNFWIALNHGTGDYVKLQNDYLSFTDDGLEFLKNILKKNRNRQIFFLSEGITTIRGIDLFHCNDLNDYIKHVSNAVTYISHFGTWKKNLCYIENPFAKRELQLMQVHWTYEILSKVKESIVLNNPVYYNFKNHPHIGYYNWFKIHIDNYYKIMNEFSDKGYVTKKTIRNDKDNTLHHLKNSIINTFIDTPDYFKFDKNGAFGILFRHFKTTPRFWFYLLCYPSLKILNLTKKIGKKYFPDLYSKLKAFKKSF